MVWMFDWSIAEVIVDQAQVLRLYGTWSLEQAVEQVVEQAVEQAQVLRLHGTWNLEQAVEQVVEQVKEQVVQ